MPKQMHENKIVSGYEPVGFNGNTWEKGSEICRGRMAHSKMGQRTFKMNLDVLL